MNSLGYTSNLNSSSSIKNLASPSKKLLHKYGQTKAVPSSSGVNHNFVYSPDKKPPSFKSQTTSKKIPKKASNTQRVVQEEPVQQFLLPETLAFIMNL
jgi:hypothetical protein